MTVRIMIGDVRARLADLPDESVHCVVTSPPYFGLRDYGTASWEGGDPACDHSVAKNGARAERGRVHHETYAPPSGWTNRDATPKTQSICVCGAIRADKQIGLEDTPAAFVAVMVEVFREVRRVLRNDGTLWLNLGDSYAVRPQNRSAEYVARTGGNTGRNALNGRTHEKTGIGDLKPKDLIGIPWRVAFALQADGWYLRQDIIWSKPNPMPESVTDRCTKAHEYLFLLTKSARYHYDAAAIAEPFADERMGNPGAYKWKQGEGGVAGGGANSLHKGNGTVEGWNTDGSKSTRNRRSVWTVATQPFSEAHFATFPPALIEPCILAGCPKDCCAKCGAPVVRQVERTFDHEAAAVIASRRNVGFDASRNDPAYHQLSGIEKARLSSSVNLGWSPSCSCDAGTARGVCLDPFGGAGTTALVADRLGRDAVLIELNEQYAEMAKRRLETDAGMFGRVDLVRSAQKQSRTPAPLSVAPSPDDSAPLPLAAVGGASA